MQFEDFDLVMEDICPHLSEPVFNYFISVMLNESNKEEPKVEDAIDTRKPLYYTIVSDQIKDKTSSTSTLQQFSSKSSIKKRVVSDKTSTKSKSSGSLWYPAKERPIRTAESGPESDILCSKLPVCRNIVSKVHLKEKIMRLSDASSEVSENESLKGDVTITDQATLKKYTNIVGRIVETDLDPDVLPLQDKFTAKTSLVSADEKKTTKKKTGVCNYSQAVSNPLYKSYNPKGYIKNDDEIAKDFIFNFVKEFNTWISGIEGDLVQLDPEIIYKIMRKDLEAE